VELVRIELGGDEAMQSPEREEEDASEREGCDRSG
jgi:hypothetical protein